MLGRHDIVLLSLTRDGRLADPRPFETFQERLPAATDCFVFCHGWLNDQTEAREGAARFFGHMDGPLRPLGERVVPLRVAVHWPSKPFANGEGRKASTHTELDLEPLRNLGDVTRRPPLLTRVLPALCAAEVPLGPEEELELDALLHLVRDAESWGGVSRSPFDALSFWLMKRRAGQVGERLGRELLAPAFMAVGDQAPRLHLIGHSFGAKLLSSTVLGGLRRDSLALLLAAFSAYAFAEEVPGSKHPGFYHRIISEHMVADRLVALRSDHDRALNQLYPAVTWGNQVERAPRPRGRLTQVRDVVAGTAMGAAGALGVGAVEVDLVAMQTTGLPHGIVTVDGSRVVTKEEPIIGAHRDIYHAEIAILVLLAAGLLMGGPHGARTPRLSPTHVFSPTTAA
jgi:hypothetical protein